MESTALMLECSLGATAIGTGITADPVSATRTWALSEVSGVPVIPSADLIEATPTWAFS
jgi:aspartate ammonia-lyase